MTGGRPKRKEREERVELETISILLYPLAFSATSFARAVTHASCAPLHPAVFFSLAVAKIAI